jgi:hypothetical protein
MNIVKNNIFPIIFLTIFFIQSCRVKEQNTHNWYEKSFYLMHLDHHTQDKDYVGKHADYQETARILALSSPDVIQIHAKGNPGWTTYPSKIGNVPSNLTKDVMAIYSKLAKNEGYHFSAYYNIGRDGVIMNTKPEWNRINVSGDLVTRSLCYHSGVAREYLWPMIEEIIDNYNPDGFWFDGSVFKVTNCYCDSCRYRFKSETGLSLPESANESGWDDFKEMQRQIFREFVHETCKLIKQKDPSCLVCFNFAYGLTMPEKPDSLVDYLSGDRSNLAKRLSLDSHWYDAQNKPFDMMTAVFLRDDSNYIIPKPEPQILQEIAIIISNGGRYFAWDHPNKESGLNEKRHQFLADIVAPFLRSRQTWCLGKRVPDVSLYHSANNHYHVNRKSSYDFSPWPKYLFGISETLNALHLNYEFISDHDLDEDQFRTQFLIINDFEFLSASHIQKLRTFLKQGGNLLITGKTIEIKGLNNLAGINDFIVDKNIHRLQIQLSGTKTTDLNFSHIVETGTAEILLEGTSYNGVSIPVLTRNRLGKGNVFYFVNSIDEIPADELLSVYEIVFNFFKPKKKRKLASNISSNTELILREKNEMFIVHEINKSQGIRDTLRMLTVGPYVKISELPSVASHEVLIQLPEKPERIILQPGNTILNEWNYNSGKLSVQIPGFDIHQMIIIEK